jgi:3-methyladenine DNA glycosylase/8-oxoguanine DNA glycosylase
MTMPKDRGTRLQTPEDFDYTRTLGFLGPRAVASMEIARPDAYIRTIWLDPGSLRALQLSGAPAAARESDFAGPVTLAVIPDADGGGVTIHTAPVLPDAVRRLLVTRMFDLDADLDAFAAAVSRDRVLGPLVRRQPRLRLPQLLDPFEGLVRAVLGQQVSVKGATTMVDRVVRLLGVPAPALDGRGPGTPDGPPDGATDVIRLLSFPRPEVMADAGEAALRGIGLTRAKAATLVRLAIAAHSGALDCIRLRSQSADDAQAALVALPGIGPWTASYVRMRALGDRDAFPVTDLGVIKALDARGVPRDRHAIVSERWRPWRAYATLHLWQSLSTAL